MINTGHKSDWDDLSKHLVLPVLYFEIFSYPLSFDEIVKFSGLTNVSKETALTKLNTLVENKMLYKFDTFYCIDNNASKIEVRLKNNERAMQLMPKARSMSSIISRFPFVQAVFISGSMSKNVMNENADIDYFIITKKDRLWICRTLLIIYKKIFLLNSHKYFCLNYFIDESHLEIPDQTIFTATEIVTLLPMIGKTHYVQFINANSWVKKYYPNFEAFDESKILNTKNILFYQLIDSMLPHSLSNFINRFLMHHTIRFWKRKYLSFDSVSFEEAFKSTNHISKHHPNQFQKKVNDAYKFQISKFEQWHQVQLT